MKYRLLGILFALAILVSCEEPESNLGLELQPQDEFVGLLMDSSTVLLKTVRHDSLRTSGLNNVVLGQLHDPHLTDLITANVYFQLRLSNPDVDFGTGATPDSLVLVLDYADDVFYGEGEEFDVQIQPLAETLHPDSIYYSYSTVATQDTNLVAPENTMVALNTEDDVIVGGDTLNAQLRIKIGSDDYDLASDIINPDNAENLDDNESFLNFLKGFKVTMTPTMGDGALYYFDLISSASKMVLYYHNDAADSLSYDFVINSQSQNYVEYVHDYQGDAGQQLEVPGTTYSQNFIQSTAGLGIEVAFPNVADFAPEENYIINKAVLQLPVADENIEVFKPNPTIQAIVYNDDGDDQNIPDSQLSSFGTAYVDGVYDDETQSYNITVTRFIQRVINGEIEEPIFTLIPSQSRTVANRVVIDRGEPNEDRRVKLIINYTTY